MPSMGRIFPTNELDEGCLRSKTNPSVWKNTFRYPCAFGTAVDVVRPRLVISQCIGLAPCRYDGKMIESKLVSLMKGRVDLLPVCPEMAIGLGAPREPIRLVSLPNGERKLVQPATGLDLTEKEQRYCSSFLMGLDQVDGFLMKSRSPTCGLRDAKMYLDERSGSPLPNRVPGLLGEALLARFSDLAVEDEAALNDRGIAEHFLTRLYSFARFRELDHEVSALMQYQADNKLLLMAYGQNKMGLLGNIASNRDKRDVEHVFQQYQYQLRSMLGIRPKRGGVVNALMHAFGYYKGQLSVEEKTEFLAALTSYREEGTPMADCLRLMRSYNLRFGNEHLNRQTFFEPFPRELLGGSPSDP
jgi:uncharacterized protein YbgA (DUF1722 family)/uncharacterized protein YbbK (DUF523 family)